LLCAAGERIHGRVTHKNQFPLGVDELGQRNAILKSIGILAFIRFEISILLVSEFQVQKTKTPAHQL
jgi:hypothetical protein